MQPVHNTTHGPSIVALVNGEIVVLAIIQIALPHIVNLSAPVIALRPQRPNRR
jgi:hypothetical protein